MRQTGSHLPLTTRQSGEHHVTVPRHKSLRLGTLSNILAEIAERHGLGREQLIDLLFGT